MKPVDEESKEGSLEEGVPVDRVELFGVELVPEEGGTRRGRAS